MDLTMSYDIVKNNIEWLQKLTKISFTILGGDLKAIILDA